MNRVTGKAAIMGNSYIARLRSFDITFKRCPNVGLNGIKINFYGKSWGNIDSLLYLIRKMKTKNYVPQVVLLQIGGNDLDKHIFDQYAFFTKLNTRIEELGVEKEIGPLKIFQWLRFSNTNLGVYANRRVTLNKGMANRFKGEGTGNIKRVQAKNLLSEGVH